MLLWHFGTIGGGGDGEGGSGRMTKVIIFDLKVLLKQELIYLCWNCDSEVLSC